MNYEQIYNPCDECDYSYSKNNQETGMCKVCEFRILLDQTDKIINLLQKELDLATKERNRYMANDNLRYEIVRDYARGIMNVIEVINEEK